MNAFLDIALIINLVLALVIFKWVLMPLHCLLSSLIYRQFMMWREGRARQLMQIGVRTRENN